MEVKITLPDWAVAHIQQQVTDGSYESAEEFILDLIEQSRPIEINDRLAELIREGMESGEGVEVTDQWWAELTDKVRAEVERRRSA